jgi:hypothetical protein
VYYKQPDQVNTLLFRVNSRFFVLKDVKSMHRRDKAARNEVEYIPIPILIPDVQNDFLYSCGSTRVAVAGAYSSFRTGIVEHILLQRRHLHTRISGVPTGMMYRFKEEHGNLHREVLEVAQWHHQRDARSWDEVERSVGAETSRKRQGLIPSHTVGHRRAALTLDW